MAERKAGRLWFGEGDQRFSFPDPEDGDLMGAMWKLRYNPGGVTEADRFRVLAAADAYRHMTTYPLGTEHVIKQLRRVRRALRELGQGR
jgi:hypothetical protein